MTDREINAEQANDIYDALVAHAGAPEGYADDFIYRQTAGHCVEYRFGGALRFGGKFWRNNGRWYVSAYPEDVRRHPEMAAVIEKTNAALAELLAATDSCSP